MTTPREVLRRLVELWDEDDGFCCSPHVREAMAAARAVLAEPEELEWRVVYAADYGPSASSPTCSEVIARRIAENILGRGRPDVRVEHREVGPWVQEGERS